LTYILHSLTISDKENDPEPDTQYDLDKNFLKLIPPFEIARSQLIERIIVKKTNVKAHADILNCKTSLTVLKIDYGNFQTRVYMGFSNLISSEIAKALIIILSKNLLLNRILNRFVFIMYKLNVKVEDLYPNGK